MRALLPDALLPDAWRLVERTGLLVDDAGLICGLAAEGELPASDWQRFPGELWAAAPVMAHAHLESWDAPADGWRREPFDAWIEDLVAWRSTSLRMSAEESAAATLEELGAAGCGTVAAHVDPRGVSPGMTPSPGRGGHGRLRPECMRFPELLAPSPSDAEVVYASVAERVAAGGGVALHAPYSVSEALASRVFSAARRSGAVVSIHLGEHREESDLLAGKPGTLGELMERVGGAPKSSRWSTPVDWLASVGGLQPGTMVVHAGTLSAHELRRLAAAGVAVVFCPGTHLWFDRPATSFEAAAVPAPALGCDSRASNQSLDPLREYRLAVEQMPAFSPQCWWHEATVGGAEALRREDLGRLAAGRRARVLRVRNLSGSDPAEACAGFAEPGLARALWDAACC